MHIILGKENADKIDEKYTVLELDSFRITGADQPVTAYAVVENMSLEEILGMKQYIDLHENTIKNYRKRNFKYCEDAIEHLLGQWGGELDSFYAEFLNRVRQLQNEELSEDWDGTLNKLAV